MKAASCFKPGCLPVALAAVLVGGLPGSLRAADGGVPVVKSAPGTVTFHSIDLSRHYYKKLNTYSTTDPWSIPPRGAQTFGGVPFWVEGRMEFTGLTPVQTKKFYPGRSAGIPVGRRGQKLHVLHGAGFADKDGSPLAKIVLRYAGGAERALRVVYGEHVRYWYQAATETKSDLVDAQSRVVWRLARDESGFTSPLRLFLTTFDNPLPEQEIASIDVCSLFSRATYVVLALTVEEQTAGSSSALVLDPTRRIGGGNADGPDESELVASMAVRVTDADGKPLRGAVVRATVGMATRSYAFGEYDADEKGRATVDFPPKQITALTLAVRAPGHLPRTFTFHKTDTDEWPRDLTAALTRGTRIGGVVLDENGKPAPGVIVQIGGPVTNNLGDTVPTILDEAGTDRDGKWATTCAPAVFDAGTIHLLYADCRRATFSVGATTREEVRQIAATDLLAGKAELKMQPGRSVEGTVVDADNQPVAGAEVSWWKAGNNTTNRTTHTDGEGRFKLFFPIAAPESELVVHAPGYAPRLVAFKPDPALRPFLIVLAAGKTLRGRVLDTDARPVEGAMVAVDNWRGNRAIKWWTQTDAEGRFAWDSAPEDGVQFTINKSDYRPVRAQELTATPKETEITLRLATPIPKKAAPAARLSAD